MVSLDRMSLAAFALKPQAMFEMNDEKCLRTEKSPSILLFATLFWLVDPGPRPGLTVR
jgi:hypothetical protein